MVGLSLGTAASAASFSDDMARDGSPPRAQSGRRREGSVDKGSRRNPRFLYQFTILPFVQVVSLRAGASRPWHFGQILSTHGLR